LPRFGEEDLGALLLGVSEHEDSEKKKLWKSIIYIINPFPIHKIPIQTSKLTTFLREQKYVIAKISIPIVQKFICFSKKFMICIKHSSLESNNLLSKTISATAAENGP
jgi:hypothetical protein